MFLKVSERKEVNGNGKKNTKQVLEVLQLPLRAKEKHIGFVGDCHLNKFVTNTSSLEHALDQC